MAVRLNREYSKNILTDRHEALKHRDYPDQHPIEAITGLKKELNSKVDKIDGKGLSTEDFLTSYKNIVKDLSVNNNLLYFRGTKVCGFDAKIVNQLPTTNISSTSVYLVPSNHSDSNNVYTEYVYVNSKWEILGSVDTNNIDFGQVFSDTIADYDPRKTYSVGQYCVYNKILYKCIGNTTGDFDTTKWLNAIGTDVSIYKTIEEYNKEIITHPTYDDCYKYLRISDLETRINGGDIDYPVELINGDYSKLFNLIYQVTGNDQFGACCPYVANVSSENCYKIFAKDKKAVYEETFCITNSVFSILIQPPGLIQLSKIIIAQTNCKHIKILGSDDTSTNVSTARIYSNWHQSETMLYDSDIDITKNNIEINLNLSKPYKTYRIVFVITSNTIIAHDSWSTYATIKIGHISLLRNVKGINVTNIDKTNMDGYVKTTDIKDLTDDDIKDIINNI